jgi:hypothetical protein
MLEFSLAEHSLQKKILYLITNSSALSRSTFLLAGLSLTRSILFPKLDKIT